MDNENSTLVRSTCWRVIACFSIVLILTSLSHSAYADGQLYRLQERDTQVYRYLLKLGVTITDRHAGELELFLTDDQRLFLEDEGFELRSAGRLPGLSASQVQGRFEESDYHNYEELTQWLNDLKERFPEFVYLKSIGQSLEGRELWAVKLSDNPTVDEMEPEVRLVGAHHGDELISVEVPLIFARYILEAAHDETSEHYELARQLLTTREIWIVPMLNPDGVERVTRWNARRVDLNRNYSYKWQEGWNHGARAFSEPETQALRDFSKQNQFVSGLSFHSGALVANYVWNYSSEPTEDDRLIEKKSLDYAARNKPMWNSSQFKNGIVRGADWYITYGDLNDWSYGEMGVMDWTIELNDSKIPSDEKIFQIFRDNVDSILHFCLMAGDGIRGIVRDGESGEPVAATFQILDNRGAPFKSDPILGDFYRPLLPGPYDLRVTAAGYEPLLLSVFREEGVDGSFDVVEVEMTHAHEHSQHTPGDDE